MQGGKNDSFDYIEYEWVLTHAQLEFPKSQGSIMKDSEVFCK